MDSYETLNNCPLSKFDSKEKFGKLAGLENQPCNLDADERQSTKPLKYYTQNFFDKAVVQNRGIFFHDGFNSVPPACEIDNDSRLRVGEMTNINLVQNLPAMPLPTTASYAKGQGSVDIEDSIRPQGIRDRNPCQPREVDFHNRHFSIFDTLPVTPNKCVKNVVQDGSAFRQGVPTRHSNNVSYKRGACFRK